MSRSAAFGLSPSYSRFDSWVMFAAVLVASCVYAGRATAQAPTEHATPTPSADAIRADAEKQASMNPATCVGEATPDGKMGAFRQSRTSDCFFLSSLIALAQDANGRALLESVFHKSTEPDAFEVVFPAHQLLGCGYGTIIPRADPAAGVGGAAWKVRRRSRVRVRGGGRHA